MLTAPTLACSKAQNEWILRVKWSIEDEDVDHVNVISLSEIPSVNLESLKDMCDHAPTESHAITNLEEIRAGGSFVFECKLPTRKSSHHQVAGYVVQLQTPSASSKYSTFLRRIELDPDTTKDVVFETRHKGLLALYDLLVQYPSEISIAYRCIASIFYLLEHENDSDNSDGASSDDDEGCHQELENCDALLDTWTLILRRMESFQVHLDLQRWAIRAGGALYQKIMSISPDMKAQMQGTLIAFMSTMLKAMDRFIKHNCLILWSCQVLVDFIQTDCTLVGVFGDRGGIEIIVNAMRQSSENLEVNQSCAQVLILCCFHDASLQIAAKQENLLAHCHAILGCAEIESISKVSAVFDLFTCLQLMMENCGRISNANSTLSRILYRNNLAAYIICTDVIPNNIGSKRKQAAALTITRFFYYILSFKRMNVVLFIMNNTKNQKLASELVDEGYIRQGGEALKSHEKRLTTLLAQRRLPEEGWDDLSIQCLLNELAQMDSNNFAHNAGAGEREARVASSLVSNRCFHLAHGVGRSGDICAVQPKAAGSSLLVQLTNCLAKDMLHIAGITNAQSAIVLPVATGMALLFAMLTLQAKTTGPRKRYVLWPRIDQKSCFKSMITAGLEPVVIENIREGDELRTNLEAIEEKVKELGPENILCVLSTTSCFAPRGYDRVEEIAQICAKYDIGHVINNAYGLQSSKCAHIVNQAFRRGRVDACVQSTDKNFLVPVGGSVICGPNKKFIQEIGKMYPGRASNAPALDLFITMLNLGRSGYKALLNQRKELVPYFKAEFAKAAEACGEHLLITRHNDISFCISLESSVRHKKTKEIDSAAATFLGSMLFSRGVSGTRVVTGVGMSKVVGYDFQGFGAHTNAYGIPYLSAACAIGMTKAEVDLVLARLVKTLSEFQKRHETSTI
ncbi:o-phosphoseryl-tRNA(Sec) selenium transferase-like [Thraustotheca clavata]|uniref:O-phosphoseryl-tRNA(Sec) selenium transferase n=1 Tax=Thraustotheca clavata TaxID=74557 RepID=A0A1W0A964_9STRA|nr:o-phosphoseryl-tRNA(Sec) selenium transferase-like [Thraustotheca clavata]